MIIIQRNRIELDRAKYYTVYYVIDLDRREIITRIDADSLEELEQELEEQKYLWKNKTIEIVQAMEFQENK